MQYLLSPLESHYDSGFGAVANSFKYAADSLAPAGIAQLSLNGHLPASFLYRHAIELYLKSGILIFHKKFNIPWGKESPNEEPGLVVNGKWHAMFNVHRLTPLHARLIEIVQLQANYLSAQTRTNWSFPQELQDWVATIDSADSSSTFFRYPVTKHKDRDKEKSSVKEEPIKSILGSIGAGEAAQKVHVVLDAEGHVVESYRLDNAAGMALLEVLRKVADCMYGCHAALRGELTGGR